MLGACRRSDLAWRASNSRQRLGGRQRGLASDTALAGWILASGVGARELPAGERKNVAAVRLERQCRRAEIDLPPIAAGAPPRISTLADWPSDITKSTRLARSAASMASGGAHRFREDLPNRNVPAWRWP